jgi:hypothetical protein
MSQTPTQDKYGNVALPSSLGVNKSPNSPVNNLRQHISMPKANVPVATMPPDCGEQKVVLGGNDIFFVTVQANAIAGVQCQADYQVQLPAKYRKFALVSCQGNASPNTLFLHFIPLYKQYASGVPGITPTGFENWFPMKTNGNGEVDGVMWIFKQGQSTIFFDWGFESGGGNNWAFTIACSQDDEFDFKPFISLGEL